MASLTRGTTFVDGVANDVTAAKLSALVDNATPTSGFIQDRTAETITATNDTLLIGDASDSNNLKRITVANFAQTLPTAKVTTGTIDTGTFGTTTSTAATITTGTITTGVIPTLTSITKITSGTGTAAAPAISPTGDTNTGIFFPAADTVAFSEGGTEGMRIDSNGNVGIGIASPTAKLEITGPQTANTVNQQWNIFSGVSAALRCGSDAHLDFGTITAHSTHLITNGTRNLSVTSAGDVGIGDTSATSKLHIYGTGSTASNPSTSGTLGATLTIQDSGGVTGNGGMLMFGANQGYHAAIKSYITTGGGNTAGDLLFCTRTNATNTTLTEAMRISSAGNVGIGDTSPAAKLDVNGSFNATSGTIPTLVATTLLTTGTGTAAAPAIVPTGDTNTGVFFPVADTIAFSEGGTESLRINSSGNVSIGTATALSKLHVHGDLTMSNATTATSASTSTITPPATVAGYLTVSINGTSRKIAYYAT